MPKGVKGPFAGYDELRLPNAGAPTQTPSSLSIDLHYAQLKIYERWNWDRFIRLAAFLNVTPHELGSIACITHHQVENLQRTNRLKNATGKDRAGALVLTLLEAHVAKHCTTDVIENPFPSLSASGSSATTTAPSTP